MALIKCGECQSEVSDKAAACPKCGAPIASKLVAKKNSGKGAALALVILGVVVFAAIGGGSKDKGDGDRQQESSEKACAKDDLSCLGNKGVIGASVYCRDTIERLALHSVKWTDGTFELKFSRFRWKDKNAGVITYIGDKVEFQNGFGAFTPMIYECDMASDNKTVLDVRAVEGRLP